MNESSLDFAEDTGDVNSGNLSGHLVVYRPPRLAHGPERNISQSVWVGVGSSTIQPLLCRMTLGYLVANRLTLQGP